MTDDHSSGEKPAFKVDSDYCNNFETRKTAAHHEWIMTATIVAVAAIVVVGMFGSTAASMVATWYRSDTFAHGYLILPLAIYLVWTRRHRILPLTPAPNSWGLPVIAIFGFVWFIGNISDVLLVQQLALVSALQILVWTVLGSQIGRALLFPLAFLFFAVPMGESLIGPLQDLTAFLAVKQLRYRYQHQNTRIDKRRI